MNYYVAAPDSLASAGPIMNRPDLATAEPLTGNVRAPLAEVLQSADIQLGNCLIQTDAILSFLLNDSFPPSDLNREPACMADTALRIHQQAQTVADRLEMIKFALGCGK